MNKSKLKERPMVHFAACTIGWVASFTCVVALLVGDLPESNIYIKAGEILVMLFGACMLFWYSCRALWAARGTILATYMRGRPGTVCISVLIVIAVLIISTSVGAVHFKQRTDGIEPIHPSVILTTEVNYTSNKTLDGTVFSTNGLSYWDSLNGTGGSFIQTRTSDVYITIGQADPSNYVYRGFLSFNTSSIPDAKIVTSAKLFCKYRANDTNAVDFDVEAFSIDYGEDLTNADYNITGPKEGVLFNVYSSTIGVWYNLSVDTNKINKTGLTQYQLRSSREGNDPSVFERITIHSADSTGNEPYLLVEYDAPPIANAGVDDIIANNTQYQFNGTNSYDPDGTIDNYTWNFTYNATFQELYEAAPTFDFNITGAYYINLTVTDDDTNTDFDIMMLTVMEVHTPIRINNDTEFNSTNGVNAGSGTSIDPYIIDNWEINGTGAGDSVFIGNTTKHFVVRNCSLFEAAQISPYTYHRGAGAQLYNVTNGSLHNNSVNDTNEGFYFDDYSKGNVTLNNITLETSVTLTTCNNITIENNTFTLIGSSPSAVYMTNDCDDIYVANHTWTVNANGANPIIRCDGTRNILYNNTFQRPTGWGSDGIVNYGTDVRITNCTFTKLDIGILIETVSSNTTIEWCDFGDMSVYALSIKKYTKIANCTLDYTVSGGGGIWVQSAGDNTIIRDCNLIDINDEAIFIHGDNVQIINCVIDDQATFGILLDSVLNTIIENVTVNNTLQGIRVNHFADNNYIGNSTITNSSIYGIKVQTSDDVTIFGCNVSHSAQDAIEFGSLCERGSIINSTLIDNLIGIDLEGKYHNITNNYIGDTSTITARGIPMSANTDYCTIFRNNITGITGTSSYGIRVTGGTDNLIYHNNFINNFYHAQDTGGTTMWDNGYNTTIKGGNYWDNYTGVDNYHGVYQDTPGGDNMGDTPQILSPAQDNYPLMNPFETNNTPTADAGYDQIGYGGFRRLYGNESSDAGGYITNWTWWFVFNGTPYNVYGERANFTFDVIGEWNVSLNITDNASNKGFDNVTIDITSVPLYFDDGINPDWDVTPSSEAGTIDTVLGRKTVHHLTNITTTPQVSAMRNYTTFSFPQNFTYTWMQYMNLSGTNDKVGAEVWTSFYDGVSGKYKRVVVTFYWNDTIVLGNNTFYSQDVKMDEWTKWTMWFTNSTGRLYLYRNGILILQSWNASSPSSFSPYLQHHITRVSSAPTDLYLDWMVLETYEVPVADAGPDQSGNEGIYTFDGSNSTGFITNYTWTFTHNSTPETIYGISPSFNFTRSGNFSVTLNATNDIVYDTDIMWVNITNQLPIADAGANDTAARGVYDFNGTGSYDPDGYITNYTWNFTYNAIMRYMYDVTPSWDFQIIGTYNVTLKVTDDENALDWDNMTLNITNTPPTADAGTNQSGLKDTYYLDGSGSTDDGTITNYTWNFTYAATPQILYGVNPSWDFQILGIYNITLNVTDNDGAWDTDNVTITINPSPPIANAGGDQAGKRVIHFDGSGSYDIDGTITNYTWNFTYDAAPVALYGVNTQFDFNISGVYMVTLTVTDDDALTGVDFANITITILPPVADAGPDQGTNKGTYTLDGSDSYDSDGIIFFYTWNFTYNSLPVVRSGVSFSYDFLLEDNYMITLNVTDNDWRYDEDIAWVNITFKPPIASGVMYVNDTNKGVKYLDAANSTDVDGTVVNYTWNFTYNSTFINLYGVKVSYNFTIEDNYVVNLNVTDDDGLYGEDTILFSIIHKDPIADAGSNRSILRWNTVTLSAAGSTDEDGYIVNYTWNITYSNTTYLLYEITTTFRFSDVGNATINLTVTDDDGLTGNATVIYNVTDPLRTTQNWLIALLPLVIILLVILIVVRYFKRQEMEVT